MTETIVYTDASTRQDCSVLACVCTRGGNVVRCWRRVVRPPLKSATAEAVTVQVARLLWPEADVRTDLSTLADGGRVEWVTRERNRHAHRQSQHDRDLAARAIRRPRGRRRGGGGCREPAAVAVERKIDALIASVVS